MTPTQLKNFSDHYASMFGNEPSERTLNALTCVDSIEELDEVEEQLSAGEFDAAEAILENR